MDVTSDVNVVPGWTYNLIQKKFFSPNSGKFILEKHVKEQTSISHPFSQDLIQLQVWLKDEANEVDPKQIIHVTGKVVSEVRCTNVERHLYNCVVSSVKEEYSVQMVIVLSQSADKTVNNKISSVLSDSSNEKLYEDMKNVFMKGFIIENDDIVELPSLRECVKMFRGILKISNKNTIRTAYMLPSKFAFGSESEVRKNFDQIPGSMNNFTSTSHNSDENSMNTVLGTTSSTMNNGQQRKNLGVTTGKDSCEDCPQPRSIDHKDAGKGKQLKEQEAQNKQSIRTNMPHQSCLDDPIHNKGASAGGAVSGHSDSKRLSKSILQVKESNYRYDKERGNNLYYENDVKKSSGSQLEKQSVANTIIESCKTVLVSPTGETHMDKNAVMKENQMCSQENGSNETTNLNSKSGKGQTQHSRSHGHTDGNKHDVTTTDKTPTSRRMEVTPDEASKSSSAIHKQKPSPNHQTTKGGKGRCKKAKVLQPINSRTNVEGIIWNYYGVAKSEGKILLLIGRSKSGKTTLVNFIANYLKGNQELDEEIIVLKNTSNATKSITAYTLCFNKNDPVVTVIDTPGLCDSNGEEKEATIQDLKALFKKTNMSLHAIGVVVPANLVHLSSSERHIINDIFTHFGEKVVDNCITFITSADTLQTPPVVDVLKSHGVKSKMVLQLNNSVFSQEMKDVSPFDRSYWKKGMKSLKKCFSHLENISPIAVKTLKVAQLEAYTATVKETSMKNLREALMHLTQLLQQSKDLTEKKIAACERVWAAGTVVQRVLSSTGKVVEGVDETLVCQAQKVANELKFPKDDLVFFLSLSKSRGLLSAGSSVIKCLAPLYNVNIDRGHNYARTNPAYQFCRKCKEDHVMIRNVDGFFSHIYKAVVKSGDSRDISYKCSKCLCLGCHHEPIITEKEPESLNLSQDWLLHHAKGVIENTLRQQSLPGHKIPTNDFLWYIDEEQNHEYHEFIEELKKK